MFPPARPAIRQTPAHRPAGVRVALAGRAGLADAGQRHGTLRRPCPVLRNRHPSPTLRPGPSPAGPHLCPVPSDAAAGLCAQGCDKSPQTRRISPRGAFAIRQLALRLRHTTTNVRGSSPCASFFSFPWFSCRSRAACPTRLPAVVRARLSAPCWPMRPTATWLPVPHLVRLPARRPVVSIWACRPAARAIDLTAACGRRLTPSTATPGTRPGVAVCISAPCRA